MLIGFFFFLFLLILIVGGGWLFMRQPQFGKAPTGARLQRIMASPNYRDGAFQNLSHTPALVEGVSYPAVIKEFFFNKNKRIKPPAALPSQKTDLRKLDPSKDVLVWFGHSSYYLQLSGKRILVDPVFSGNASPVTFTTKSFDGADVYTADDMPEIDYLFISHDHFDHLDYKTISKLMPRVKKVITGLGVGAHLEHWGYEHSRIQECDWNEQVLLDDGFVVNTAPGRHFSGRKFKRNGTIWLSFILSAQGRKIFIGGDSGYDSHFSAIGSQYGPFDLVILEDGQYDKNWKYIHMMPEEVVQAAIDLRAKKLLPVHWAKFTLSVHDWDDPIRRVVKEARLKHMPLIHPMIGEVVDLDTTKEGDEWWNAVK